MKKKKLRKLIKGILTAHNLSQRRITKLERINDQLREELRLLKKGEK